MGASRCKGERGIAEASFLPGESTSSPHTALRQGNACFSCQDWPLTGEPARRGLLYGEERSQWAGVESKEMGCIKQQ